MADQDWVVIDTVPGDLQAEILRGFLEAQGIPVLLSQEGAGRAIGLSVGPLGEVEILVPEQNHLEAMRLLADYRAGLFETDEELEDSEPLDPES
jgi:hypothetical protein